MAGSGKDAGERLLARSAVPPGSAEPQPEQWPRQDEAGDLKTKLTRFGKLKGKRVSIRTFTVHTAPDKKKKKT